MRRVPDHQRWFGCCIDLDYSAVNTIGNAVETRRWALGHGFRSLVVVTSSYHMPRAMLELSHQLPGVTLIAYPVVTPQRRAEGWWSASREREDPYAGVSQVHRRECPDQARSVARRRRRSRHPASAPRSDPLDPADLNPAELPT